MPLPPPPPPPLCRRSAEALSPNSPARLDDGLKLDPTAYHAYLINCLAAMQVRLWGQRGGLKARDGQSTAGAFLAGPPCFQSLEVSPGSWGVWLAVPVSLRQCLPSIPSLAKSTRITPTAHTHARPMPAPSSQAVTSLRPFCSGRTASLGAAISTSLESLVGGEVRRLLGACGLAETAERIRLYFQAPGEVRGLG